jgi:hypothetical protein
MDRCFVPGAAVWAALTATSLMAFAQEQGDPPRPKGDRLLGINVNQAQDKNFDHAFRLARQAGLQVVSLKLDWDDIERKPGEYVCPWPAVADAYYSAAKVRLSLRIATLDTNRNRVPLDLRTNDLGDPAVVARFNALVDWLAQQMPRVDIEDISIGNEADGSLGTDAEKWAQYITFFRATGKHAKTLWPKAKIGSSLTFAGHRGAARRHAMDLNRHTDVVMVSYYPLGPNMMFRDPTVVQGDFEAICAQYPERDISYTECGYPSGTTCGASQDKQKQFVEEVFRAWDAHADQIKMVMFVWLTDQPEAGSWARNYYGIESDAFADFIGTLGLRTYNGSGADKPAFVALQTEAEKRGW